MLLDLLVHQTDAHHLVAAQCTEAIPSCLSCMTLDCQADGASKALQLASISNGGRSSLKQLCIENTFLCTCMQHRGDHVPLL